MKAGWWMVGVAAVFEVLWVIGLKYAATPLMWIGTLIAIVVSFYFMVRAGETVAVGTVYTVFVGLGTVGTTAVDMLVFGEPFQIVKVLLIALLLAGVIGLTLIQDDKKEGEE